MGERSKIEWTHHTFNPWWGCMKVSAGCKNCYAESWANRLGLSLWDKGAGRRFFGDAHWREPSRWNREAERSGERRRVFCASMADVFEDRRELDGWRGRLWPLIEATPWLDWLLLTKRPQNIGKLAPWNSNWPTNVWLGTTAENQHWAEKRIPILMDYPAAVRFISAEPLLGPIDLAPWLAPLLNRRRATTGVNWVIAGGESGPRARPMSPAWTEQLRDQCLEARVPFHFKQWGHWGPSADAKHKRVDVVQFFDQVGKPITLYKVGKSAAGRELAGRTWDELPAMRA